MKRLLCAFYLILFLAWGIYMPVKGQNRPELIDYIQEQNAWVDSVYNRLSLKKRIAQLFMVRAHTNLGQAYQDSVAKVIRKEQLGGIVLFQGTPTAHARLINRYQSLSKTPLWVAMDGEWGLGMRLPDSTVSYPYQMTLGAIQDDRLLFEMGRQVALDFKRLGVHINFAPVVDVNNNANNPVINYRSFGENIDNVTQKASAYLKGMESQGLLSTLKHFPGHGDTDVDSHYSLPKITHDKTRLDSVELYPFAALIKQGATGVMIAHLQIPALDPTPGLPSSLSAPIITDLLKNELGFKGLVFTDAMDMSGVAAYFKNGEAELLALQAGVDVLELAKNSRLAIKKIKRAVRKKEIDKKELETKVKKILAAKHWLGLAHPQAINTEQLIPELNRIEALHLNQELANQAVTLLRGKESLHSLDFNKKTALISIGQSHSAFSEELEKEFSALQHFFLPADADSGSVQQIARQLPDFEQIFVSVHDTRTRPGNVLPLSAPVHAFISSHALSSHVSFFANPYSLKAFPELENSKSLIVAYQNQTNMQLASAWLIAGKIISKGRLPVTINSFFTFGHGL